MSELHVLVIGPGPASVSDELRFHSLAPALSAHHVILRSWPPPLQMPDPVGRDVTSPRSAATGGGRRETEEYATLEAALDWAAVVVFRRFYRTWHACLTCHVRTLDGSELRNHRTATGHEVVAAPFALVRPLVELLEADRAVLGDRAIVYETDDDLLAAAGTGGDEDWLELDLVRRLLGLADLVTTTTPVLAGRLRPYTRAPIRIIRNALDARSYAAPPADSAAPGVRVVYHGVAKRLGDYRVAQPAIDSISRQVPGLRRVWLGTDDPSIRAIVDETRPFVRGLAAFAASLAAARPDVGVAPLAASPYNRSRSELHWLEYALAGAPAIVTGWQGPGPYDPVRDGIDGFVARNAADWRTHLRRLVSSPALRTEIAGRARERAVAEYDLTARAEEWADAYRSAAEGRAGQGSAVA